MIKIAESLHTQFKDNFLIWNFSKTNLQALGMFSAALQSGQLGPLMQQFGMSADVVTAANSGGKISLLFPFFYNHFILFKII